MIAQHREAPPELVTAFELLSQLIPAEESLKSAVERIAELSVRAVDAADDCTITVKRGQEVETLAATSNDVEVIGKIQQETGQGPCLSAIKQHRTFVIDDLATDDTWPQFSPRAAQETGIRSVVAYVLEVHHEAFASLNLVSLRAGAFTQADVDAGVLFAAHVAVALKNVLDHETLRTQVDQLEQGMRTRQMIGQAVGIIMATRHCTADEAFDTLKTISQNTNTKLRDIAQELVEKADEMEGP